MASQFMPMSGRVASETIVNKASFDAYTDTCCDTDPMSKEMEVAAFRALKAGDESQRNRIILANQRFVVRVASYYAKVGKYSVQDLISAGNIGLLDSIDRFDQEKGVKFVTYAVWRIRREIQKELLEMGRAVATPVNGFQHIHAISKACNELNPGGQSHALLDRKLVAEVAKCPLPAVDSFFVSLNVTNSLDEPLSKTGSSPATFLDTLKSDSDAGRVTGERADRELVDLILADLPPKKAEILRLRFGIDDGQERTLDEVGQIVGKTRERIRQVCDECMYLVRVKRRFLYAREAVA